MDLRSGPTPSFDASIFQPGQQNFFHIRDMVEHLYALAKNGGYAGANAQYPEVEKALRSYLAGSTADGTQLLEHAGRLRRALLGRNLLEVMTITCDFCGALLAHRQQQLS